MAYLGPEIKKWLDYENLSKNFKELLKIPFYANVTRRIGLQPDADRKRVENRGDLLAEFEVKLFQEARYRHKIIIHDLDESRIQDLLYRLSLDTLTENEIQTFPSRFLDKYREDYPKILKIIFDVHWVFFNKTLFEGKDESRYTFYHQLLQEYFAARRLSQLFEKDPDAFDKALMRLPFSQVALDLLDDLLPHERAFNHCMNRFKTALAQADREKKGIEGTGHKFTWLLALRDSKGKKPGLKKGSETYLMRKSNRAKKRR